MDIKKINENLDRILNEEVSESSLLISLLENLLNLGYEFKATKRAYDVLELQQDDNIFFIVYRDGKLYFQDTPDFNLENVYGESEIKIKDQIDAIESTILNAMDSARVEATKEVKKYVKQNPDLNKDDLSNNFKEYMNEDSSSKIKDMEKSVDDIFSDISGWAFPFVDLELLRMYDEADGLINVSDDELLKYLKEQGFGIFKIEDASEIEDKDIVIEDYLGMTFVSPQLTDNQLSYEVIKNIRKGEI